MDEAASLKIQLRLVKNALDDYMNPGRHAVKQFLMPVWESYYEVIFDIEDRLKDLARDKRLRAAAQARKRERQIMRDRRNDRRRN